MWWNTHIRILSGDFVKLQLLHNVYICSVRHNKSFGSDSGINSFHPKTGIFCIVLVENSDKDVPGTKISKLCHRQIDHTFYFGVFTFS